MALPIMTKPYFVESPAQLSALASPGREDLLDAVGLLGPCKVSDLARFLGRSPHALYYHLRQLLRHDLLLESRRLDERNTPAAYYDVPGRPIIVRYDLSTKRGRRAVTNLGTLRLRSAIRGFVRACRVGNATTRGSLRNLWVAHWKGWLSDQDLARTNRIFQELVALFRRAGSAPRKGRRPHEISFAIAPILTAGNKSRTRT